MDKLLIDKKTNASLIFYAEGQGGPGGPYTGAWGSCFPPSPNTAMRLMV